MAAHTPGLAGLTRDIAISLLAEREVMPRAQIIAARVAELIPGSAVVLYLLEGKQQPAWAHKAVVGDVTLHRKGSIPRNAGALGQACARRASLVLSGSSTPRESYAHLDVRRTVVSLGYAPIRHHGDVVGMIEVLTFDRPLDATVLHELDPLLDYAAVALTSAVGYEDERNGQFATINRLTQLYDLERSFNSTLQMDQLLPIITSKIAEVLEVEAVNLWMEEEEEGGLLLVKQHGGDTTVQEGMHLPKGEGIAGEVSDSGKGVIIFNPSDERLVRRNGGAEPPPVRTLIAVPVLSQNYQVGVLEAINRLDGRSFNDDDGFYLGTIAITAGSALHNASLLEAERKIEVLETLVEVSREITSTLNLDRVLQVVVNAPQRIMAYDRAAIAIEQSGKLQLKAISGKTEVVASDPQVRRLRDIVEWAADAGNELFVAQHGNQVAADRQETVAKFQEYFAASGSRAFYAVPLRDDQGLLGILTFESRNPNFLSDAHFEFIKVLAGQATVAVRNASLYTEVPFIGVLEPLIQKKQAFMRMEKKRRTALAIAAAALVLFLAVCPLPMRVEGEAVVAPLDTARIQAEVEGVVRNVYVKEGDRVAAGAVLADMEDWDYRGALAGAEAKYATAVAAMNQALAANDGGEAGVQRVQAEFWQSEVERARARLEHTKLRSPINGIVATARVEELAGHKLEVGDLFAQVVDSSRASVDVTVDQQDLPLLRSGEELALKLESFPTRKFHGRVTVVSPAGTPQGDHRVFYARAEVPNPDGALRPGMQGMGKVWTGWRPAGYVFFRTPAAWLWSKIWSWVGW
ncbi:MAG TPA: efflux RND transporter periplasmic adaptor subunit [Terriglobales bacterium]|nr:efflux RND transporter periplasmic adaptor subunit [Terriglobales bacterium]